ncbi:winged helix-turn-helix domain-containing protein [Pseudomonas sp. NMI542_15]|uniref:winged helix-turn-helix domain-containing protein n=1 Tax=Pseudomonas sp. NMI542_15 TaxID=2903148 RepID=UPI001E5A4A75|nr:DNA-binding protein [Pseudomonas sp. NMI542_15]MCE0782298.1 DNA-binding protein [Pseudomonas sp. NMI542_15]
MEVCYDAERMTLSRANLSTTLGSNESDLLLALIAGITDKEAIISQVWGARGLVVSDSSYYKTVHALRSKLVDVGVPRDSLKTLPKRGLILLCEITMVSADVAVERDMPLHLEQDRPRASSGANEQPVGNDSKQSGSSETVAGKAELAEERQNAVMAPLPLRDGWIRRNSHLFLPALAFLGASLPVIYAYLMFHKPPDLEAWKRVWESDGATLYVEQSENMSKDDVLAAMAGFEPALVLKDSNYYVRKPLSQLLVSCVKPESHGEALCVNYLRVGKK